MKFKTRIAWLPAWFLVATFINVVGPSVANGQNSPTGSILVGGGGHLSDDIIRNFIELAGGSEARIVVIPTATSDSNLPSESAISTRWKRLGVDHVTLLHTRDRIESDRSSFSKPIKEATGVWISGGAQSRLASAYVDTAVESELLELVRRGGIVGGSSAGAAIMSRVMIESGKTIPKISRGFDLVPNVIFDQHFLKRNRMHRLQNAVTQNPDRVGLGIDEGTAILVRDGQATVLGKSYVIMMAIPAEGKPIALKSFHAGDQFRIPKSRD